MITLNRSAAIVPGHIASAHVFAKEIAAVIKAKTGVEVAVTLPIGGNPNRIGWVARFENLAAYDSTMDRLRQDPQYVELLAKGGLNFIPGSVFDEIWRTV